MGIKVTLVRHAETRLNLDRVLQGSLNEPLSDSGISQARKLGYGLREEKFSHVYSSGLLRAVHTAQWICCQSRYPPAHVQLDSRLRERCYGISEGAPISLFKENAAKFGYGNGIHYLYTPPAGESYSALTDRVVDFFRFLCTLADESPDDGEQSVGNIVGLGMMMMDDPIMDADSDGGTDSRPPTTRILEEFEISRGGGSPQPGGCLDRMTDPSPSILVVSHGSLITALLRYLHNEPKLNLIGFDPTVGLLTPGNTGITRFTIGCSGSGEGAASGAVGGGMKRQIHFSCINDLTHLSLEIPKWNPNANNKDHQRDSEESGEGDGDLDPGRVVV